MNTDSEEFDLKQEAVLCATDALDLADMGHAQELTRKFSKWSMLALAFSIMGTWGLFAQDMAEGLINGGPITIIYGMLLTALCLFCVVLSMAEMCSAMPTALGEAYWIYKINDSGFGRFLSYICAWLSTFGWWAAVSSLCAFTTNFTYEMIASLRPGFFAVYTGWTQFLLYTAIATYFTMTNCVVCRNDKLLPWITNVFALWFAVLMLAFMIALLVSVGTKDDLSFQPAKFVFATWLNYTDWPSGVVWFSGLLQAAYGLTAFEAVIHMAEEIPDPRRNIPKVLSMALIIGLITGGIFMIVCLFCIQNVDDLLNSTVPFVDLTMGTVGKAGGTALIVMYNVDGLGQGITLMASSSRMTWGFARDGGLPFSSYFAVVDKYWKVPIRSICLNGVIVVLIGLLYLFSTTVIQAIISVVTVTINFAFAMPIGTLLFYGRDKLPQGPFQLGR
ncbi:hypothetical protein TRVA0_001S05006 [Trichomonascus vanleenenianus]|uniref:uncharacterized protein n=1 Tax=Trichomonascus vanleenenianus TaxID=2268995 RepID=UPI003EC98387